HRNYSEPIGFVGALQPSALATGDLDGDGAIDLAAVSGATGQLTVFLHGADETCVSYCTAGTTTHGCTPSIVGVGAPSASAASGFELRVTGVEGQAQGTLFYGLTGRVAWPWAPGSSSYLCVAPPTQRFVVANSGGTSNTCSGSYTV